MAISGGGGQRDKTAFTASASQFNPLGGTFNDSMTNLVSGEAGSVRLTIARALHVNLRDAAGAELASLPVTGTFWQATQPVSAASLPLPAGAATETTLAGINTKLPAVLPGGTLPGFGNAAVQASIREATQEGTTLGATPLTLIFSGRKESTGTAMVPRLDDNGQLKVTLGSGSNGTRLMRKDNADWLDTTEGSNFADSRPGFMVFGRTASGSGATSFSKPFQVDASGYLQVAQQGSVAVTGTFWQATQPVSGTFWQATQPVSMATLPALVAGTAYVGKIRQTDGTLDLSLLNAAPGSDTGQVAVPVRVISQLGAGAGGASGPTKLYATQARTSVSANDTVNVGAYTSARIKFTGGYTGTVQVEQCFNTNGAQLLTRQASIEAISGTIYTSKQFSSGNEYIFDLKGVGSLVMAYSNMTGGTATMYIEYSTEAFESNPIAVTIAQSVLVNGIFWQATQPVSGTVAVSNAFALDATLTGGTQRTKVTDGTNNAAVKAASTAAVAADPALVVAVSPNNTVGVTGTFWQATQPVSAASLPLPTGAATETTLAALNTKHPTAAAAADAYANPTITHIGADNMLFNGTTWDRAKGDATNGALVRAAPASLVISITGAASATVTATLPAAGAGLFHYITRINIMKYATAAMTGSATPSIVTSTNLPGSLAWTTPTALAIGTQYETDVQGSAPLKSSVANTATTVVAPVATSGSWRINVYYYTGI